MSAFGDRRLLVKAGVALVLANIRFWPTVAPLVAVQLKRWERHARKIRDPTLQALALQKLDEERFNAEVAATLATLAPPKHRNNVIEAIVAYEVMYDYLDGLTEQPTANPLDHGHQLYQAFTDAIAPDAEPTSHDYLSDERADDSGYLAELVRAVRGALRALPSTEAISQVSQRAARRCAEAQIRAHSVPRLGTTQLEQWAAHEVTGTPFGWQEFLAGAASSVLAVHALIVVAADERTTPQEAAEIDTVYLSICALSTMLDSLVDYYRDTQAGQAGYIRYYQNHDLLTRDLTRAVRRAIHHATPLPNGAHHVMTLVGVAAYYISGPAAHSDFAQPVTRQVRRQLEPLITPTLAVMRTWRAAKRAQNAISPPTLMRTAASVPDDDPNHQVTAELDPDRVKSPPGI
jgi:tetraprenyl-beta-curcumene synthase